MGYNIGPTISVDGEAEYRKQINNLIQQSRTLGSEMKLVAASFDKDASAKEKSAAKSKVLSEQIEVQKQRISAMADMLQKSTEKYGELDDRTLKWQQTVNDATAELRQMEAELKDSGGAVDKAKTNWGAFGDTIGKVGAAAAKTVAVLGTAVATAGAVAGAAAISIGKSVVSAYADYEQFVGGVDTLFKENSQTLQNYAANAYKTAGLSANDYMDTVTSFSASLISSLGGDTGKAVEYADKAITDMSDNANKMGTDMASIQNAYQGFAKQNYTMLDNLKLGYGGTKEEMARLLADAQAISGVNYDISSYADVVSAIHVIQENMGIAGATAREAESTIEGSVNAMKAAFQNLIVGFGDSNADIGMLSKNLVDAFSTVATNIAPVLQNIAAALPTAFAGMLPAIMDLLPGLLATASQLFAQVLSAILGMLPQLIPVATDAIGMVGNALLENLPQLIAFGGTLVSSFAGGIVSALPALSAVAAEMFGGLIGYLQENFPQLVEQGLQALLSFSEGIRANAGSLVDGAIQMVKTLADGIISNIPTIIQTVPTIITNFAGVINDNMPKILATGVGIIAKLAMGLVQAIPTLVQNIPQIIMAIVSTFTAFGWMNLGKTIITGLANGIKGMAGGVREAATGIGESIKNGLLAFKEQMVTVGKNLVQGLANGIKAGASWAVQAIKNLAASMLEGIKAFFGIHSPSRVMRDQVGVMIGLGIAEGMHDSIPEVQKAAVDIGDAMTSQLEKLNKELAQMQEDEQKKQDAKELAAHKKAIADKYTELGKAEKKDKQKIQDEIAELQADWNEKQVAAESKAAQDALKAKISALEEYQKEYDKSLNELQESQDSMADKLKGYGDLFTNVQSDTGNYLELGDLQSEIDKITAYGDALEALKQRGAPESLISEITSMNVDDATAYTNKLLSKTDEDYAEYMKLWEEKQATAADVAKRFYSSEFDNLKSEFVDKLPNELSGVKTEMRDLGVLSGQGVAAGFRSQSDYIKETFTSVLESAMAAARTAMDIHSPSRKWAKLVGAPMAQGVGVGFTNQMRDVAKQINESIPVPTMASSGFERAGEGIVNGLAAVMQGGTSTQRIEVPVYLDGKEIARAAFDPIQQVARQRGVAFG